MTHLCYFRPCNNTFLSRLEEKVRQSAKEWKYVNSAGLRSDLDIMALDVERTGEGTVEDVGGMKSLAESDMRASHDVLCMREQYFSDITEKGV